MYWVIHLSTDMVSTITASVAQLSDERDIVRLFITTQFVCDKKLITETYTEFDNISKNEAYLNIPMLKSTFSFHIQNCEITYWLFHSEPHHDLFLVRKASFMETILL